MEGIRQAAIQVAMQRRSISREEKENEPRLLQPSVNVPFQKIRSKTFFKLGEVVKSDKMPGDRRLFPVDATGNTVKNYNATG